MNIVREVYKTPSSYKKPEGMFCVANEKDEVCFTGIPGLDRPRIFNRIETARDFIDSGKSDAIKILKVAFIQTKTGRSLEIIEEIK